MSVEAGSPPGLLGTLPARETRSAVIPVSFQALKGMGVSGERAENKSVCVCVCVLLHTRACALISHTGVVERHPENSANHHHNNINDDHNGSSDKSSQHFLALTTFPVLC